MRNYAANAIVLKRIDLGEKDRILTLYSRELGRLSAVAKGARRPGSKLGGASEPFTYEKIFCATGRDLDILSQAEIRESFPNVKREMRSIAYAVYLLELTNAFIDDRQPNPALFDTLLSAMYLLESGTDPEITARYYELSLLDILGYSPHMDVCLQCGKKTSRERVAFSPALGGCICADDGPPPSDSIWIPGAAASYVRALQIAEPHKLKDMKIPKGARHDLSKILKWHIRYRLEKDLRSIDFIDALESFEGED